jgi:hypothetical protein
VSPPPPPTLVRPLFSITRGYNLESTRVTGTKLIRLGLAALLHAAEKRKRLQAGVFRFRPLFLLYPVYQSGSGNYATIFKLLFPMFIGVPAFLKLRGGLTRKFALRGRRELETGALQGFTSDRRLRERRDDGWRRRIETGKERSAMGGAWRRVRAPRRSDGRNPRRPETFRAGER